MPTYTVLMPLFRICSVHGSLPRPRGAAQGSRVRRSSDLDRQDRIGSIEAGKFADIVATSGDPSLDVKDLVAGKYDHLPEAAFYMVGTIEEAVEKGKKLAAEAA